MRIVLTWLLGLALVGAAPRESYEKEIKPLLEHYCFDCHGDGSSKGDFSMDAFKDLSGHLADQEHWMAIWRNLRSQIMPPSDEEQLATEEKRKVLAWIERDVFQLDPNDPDPGRVTIRRLNREEYKNAVFDLLGVEFDTTEAFPPDDTGYGFDNIGDVLSISPLLMEKYLTAAEEVVNLALPEGSAAQVPRLDLAGEDFVAPGDPTRTGRWLPFAQAQRVVAKLAVPFDGDYQVDLEYAVRGAMEATDHSADLAITAGGHPVNSERLGWDQRRVISLGGKAPLKAGPQEFAVTLAPSHAPAPGEEELALAIRRVIVRGPLDGSQTEYSKGYRMIMVDGPAPEEETAREQYARRIMRSFVSRAFRVTTTR